MTPEQDRDLSRRGIIQCFGIGAWWLAQQQDSLAAVSSLGESFPIGSSSFQVADEIKTLDMSMPSYEDIKSFKASVETVEGLSVPPASGKAKNTNIMKVTNPKAKPLVLQFPGSGKEKKETKGSLEYNF
jgi:hypothetical protein